MLLTTNIIGQDVDSIFLMKGNIPVNAEYDVFISQLIRYLHSLN